MHSTQFFIDKNAQRNCRDFFTPTPKNYTNKSVEWNMTKWQMTRLANKIICFIFSHPPADLWFTPTQYIIDNKATNFWHFYDCPRTVNWNQTQTMRLNGRSADNLLIRQKRRSRRWRVLIKNNHITDAHFRNS